MRQKEGENLLEILLSWFITKFTNSYLRINNINIFNTLYSIILFKPYLWGHYAFIFNNFFHKTREN